MATILRSSPTGKVSEGTTTTVPASRSSGSLSWYRRQNSRWSVSNRALGAVAADIGKVNQADAYDAPLDFAVFVDMNRGLSSISSAHRTARKRKPASSRPPPRSMASRPASTLEEAADADANAEAEAEAGAVDEAQSPGLAAGRRRGRRGGPGHAGARAQRPAGVGHSRLASRDRDPLRPRPTRQAVPVGRGGAAQLRLLRVDHARLPGGGNQHPPGGARPVRPRPPAAPASPAPRRPGV